MQTLPLPTLASKRDYCGCYEAAFHNVLRGPGINVVHAYRSCFGQYMLYTGRRLAEVICTYHACGLISDKNLPAFKLPFCLSQE